jgi:polar amino acid transport system permease protein
MGNFDKKLERFWEIFYEQDGYNRVLTGLGNTLQIAIIGLAIGIVIGTIIAIVKVYPKYKTLPKILDGICTLYVGLFRGTPIVVQLLLAYYVILPLIGVNLPALQVCILVFGMNSGAYVSEIMRSGILSVDPGQMEAGRALGLSYSVSMLKIVVPGH